MISSSNLIRDMKVGTKLMLVPLFFIAALCAILYFTVTTMQKQERYLVVLELVGRQRMLQHMHFSTALLVSQGKTPASELDYVGEVWESTQRSLTYGGEAVARMRTNERVMLPPPPNEEVKKLLGAQTILMENALASGERLAAAPIGTPEYEARLQEHIALQEPLREASVSVARACTKFTREEAKMLIDTQKAITIAVGLLGLLFSWVVASGIVRPLQRVVEAASNISQGNLRMDKLRLGSRDELGILSDSFDSMLDNLKELSSQILVVTGNVNSASAEILASTQQQASSTKEQAATVQEISTTMQEISQSGTEIGEKAKQVASSAEATAMASQSGIEAVQNTSRLMESIRQQVEEVASKIVSLSERTQAIGEIVNTVNEISEQSNLLALNASIEAASAGEQGSRFAVVAGEMRNLAQRAKGSTVQVGSILGEIQRGINSTVMLAEEAVKRSESGKQQAELTEQTIHQMTETTVESVNAFQQIIGATSQQQIGFEQVTQGMRDIRQAAEQTAIGTGQLERAIANLNELSGQLRTAVGRYQL